MAELEAVASRGKAFLVEFQTLSVHFGNNEEEGEEEGREEALEERRGEAGVDGRREEEGEDRSGSWLDSNENVVH